MRKNEPSAKPQYSLANPLNVVFCKRSEVSLLAFGSVVDNGLFFDGFAEFVVDVAAAEGVEHGDGDENSKKEEGGEEDHQVELIVVPQMHKDHGNQGGFESRNRHCYDQIEWAKIEASHFNRDYCKQEQSRAYAKIDDQRSDVGFMG